MNRMDALAAWHLSQGNPLDGSEVERKRLTAVSPRSDFKDDEWFFEIRTRGAKPSLTLHWDIEPPAGAGLDRDEWFGLLREGKALVAALLHLRNVGTVLKPESLTTVYYPLLFLIRWLFTQGVPSLMDITPSVADRFLDHLGSEKVTEAEEPVKRGTITAYVKIVCHAFDQQRAMRAWLTQAHGQALEGMPRHPFDGLRSSKVAALVVGRKKDRGWIPPVPDQVWLPVVRTAMDWLDAPAAHVIRFGAILAEWLDAAGEDVPDGQDLWIAIQGSDCEGTLTAWLIDEAASQLPTFAAGDRLRNRPLLRLYRFLLKDLRDACTIVFQAMLGLRVSELAGLDTLPPLGDGSRPGCLRIDPSRTGINEIFHVEGWVFKGKNTPTIEAWIAGTRPVGTSHLPVAVKAVHVLHEAFMPWRLACGSKRLLLPMSDVPGGRAGSGDLDEILSPEINQGQKDFVRRRVALPPSHRDWRLSTHQWRKSFAIHMVRADESLLGPVSEHFKHLNAAVTEQGYVGCDTEMLGYMHDAGLQQMAWTLHKAINGKAVIAGPMADTILERVPALDQAAGIDAPLEDRLHRLKQILKEADVRVASAEWGRCVFRPEISLCRPAARNPGRRRATGPDYANRQPGLCCTCANLLVTDGHEGFWRGRLLENLDIRRSSRASGDRPSAAVATTRVRQSLKVLRKLKAATARNGGDDAAA